MTGRGVARAASLVLLAGSGVCWVGWQAGGPRWLLPSAGALFEAAMIGVSTLVVWHSHVLSFACSLLSLLLCLAVIGLWVRSYWVCDTAGWYVERIAVLDGESRAWGVCSDSGGLLFFDLRRVIQSGLEEIRYRPPYTYISKPNHLTEGPSGYPYMWPYRGWGYFGFGVFGGQRSPPMQSIRHDDWFLVVPDWFVAACLAAPAVGWLLRLHRRRRAIRDRRAHLCLSCGYDLRATPARCPECGALP